MNAGIRGPYTRTCMHVVHGRFVVLLSFVEIGPFGTNERTNERCCAVLYFTFASADAKKKEGLKDGWNKNNGLLAFFLT